MPHRKIKCTTRLCDHEQSVADDNLTERDVRKLTCPKCGYRTLMLLRVSEPQTGRAVPRADEEITGITPSQSVLASPFHVSPHIGEAQPDEADEPPPMARPRELWPLIPIPILLLPIIAFLCLLFANPTQAGLLWGLGRGADEPRNLSGMLAVALAAVQLLGLVFSPRLLKTAVRADRKSARIGGIIALVALGYATIHLLIVVTSAAVR